MEVMVCFGFTIETLLRHCIETQLPVSELKINRTRKPLRFPEVRVGSNTFLCCQIIIFYIQDFVKFYFKLTTHVALNPIVHSRSKTQRKIRRRRANNVHQ